MAGLFFCLASTRCRAFILPGGVSAKHKHLQRPFCHPCNYTTKTQKPFTGLYRSFSVDLLHSSAHNTTAIQAAYTPPRRTLCRLAQPPYYNKVYKGAAVRPCRGSMPDRATHRRLCQSGGAEPLAACRRISFRAFAR